MSDRDWGESEYVRVYQSIRSDPKFATVYGNDRALAAWVRLLLDADLTFPVPTSLPAHLSKYARDVLTKAGILSVTGSTYVLSGLSKERQFRFSNGKGRPRYPSDKSPKPETSRSDVGAESEPSRSGPVVVSDPHAGAGASSSVLGFSEGGAGGNDDPPLTKAIDYIETRSGRPWTARPGQKLWDTLDADLRDFGLTALLEAMWPLPGAHPDHGQLIYGATRRLHPIAPPPDAKAVREDEDHRRGQRELERTRRMLDEQAGVAR